LDVIFANGRKYRLCRYTNSNPNPTTSYEM